MKTNKKPCAFCNYGECLLEEAQPAQKCHKTLCIQVSSKHQYPFMEIQDVYSVSQYTYGATVTSLGGLSSLMSGCT